MLVHNDVLDQIKWASDNDSVWSRRRPPFVLGAFASLGGGGWW